MLKILIDIGHPAHVHLFRNFIFEMKKKGHNVIVTTKDIPIVKKLLKLYAVDYIEIGKKSDSLFGKLFNQFIYNKKIYNIVKMEKIEYGLGVSISVPHVSFFTKMKSFVFDDDDSSVESFIPILIRPFTNHFVSPDCLTYDRNLKKDVIYAGYHELAYLHPNRFVPDPSVLTELDICADDVFFIMRFNVFKAYHDRGIKGLSLDQKIKLIELLAQYGKIFITTERGIEPELAEYQLNISPEKIHSLLFYATMFIGDSQTMTSEAAVLGTPAIKCNSLAGKLSVSNEIEKRYGLCFSYPPGKFNDMINKIEELLMLPNLKKEWGKKRKKMISEKIDVTSFMVWLIENYPKSLKMIKENSNYVLSLESKVKRSNGVMEL